MKTKRIVPLILAILTAFGLTSCTPASEPDELTVFAAASLTETLTEIADLYAAKEPNVKLIFNFDSSGTLKTQVESGAECDIFISAAQKQVNELEDADYVHSRRDILENKVVLAVPKDNPKEIGGFDALAQSLSSGEILLAMGNSDVPVGQYTQKILGYYGLDEEELAASGVISYGSNVKEVTTQVSENSADCGIIYCTDAFSAGLDVVDYATEEMCGRVVYPAAVLKESENKKAALAFLEYLSSDEAMAAFEKVGFTKP